MYFEDYYINMLSDLDALSQEDCESKGLNFNSMKLEDSDDASGRSIRHSC